MIEHRRSRIQELSKYFQKTAAGLMIDPILATAAFYNEEAAILIQGSMGNRTDQWFLRRRLCG